MTDSYIRRSLRQIKIQTSGLQQKYIPVLLSDSKGSYIKREVTNLDELKIEFISQSGSRLRDSILWVRNNLHKRTKRYKNIHVYVWLGNCDITAKSGRYLNLRFQNTSSIIKYIKDKLEDIILAIKVSRKKNTPRVTLLEIPHYSLVEYNSSQKHPEPRSFYEDDIKLSKQIDSINSVIRQLNTSALDNARSPRFSLDLTRPTKGHKGQRAKARSHYNFKHVYVDGEHPNPLLAKLWYQRIGRQMVFDCFTKSKKHRHRHRKSKNSKFEN
ncbi:Hypothetical predicted protein [Mytilus galloprovincialis]|uniref:Uncharacterized protein n=1 Tax=Mytilus galloprovincialis TaxID=29158 RepID=A0A8B6F8H0_MYTGA|nr:Hypothetical predicted protein [Mytilus galloprovincialis]